jgi:sigma-B regulation protein RsbU (phosphoserine phosphatase)
MDQTLEARLRDELAARRTRLDFFVGDVMGHGVAASLLMARLNALFRSLVDAHLPVADLMSRMNRLFQDRASESHFVTAICGRARADGTIELCNAGHCAPLCVRARGVERIALASGLPVGVAPGAAFTSHEVRLAPGDVLFLCTDGMLEARDPQGRLFGEAGLRRALERRRGTSLATMAAGCIDDLAHFQGDKPLADDLTILALRHRS